jgi:hypothetical protein
MTIQSDEGFLKHYMKEGKKSAVILIHTEGGAQHSKQRRKSEEHIGVAEGVTHCP